MPRKQRTPKRQRVIDLSIEQMAERAALGGILPDLPALTDDQREIWEAYRRGQSDWVPHRALYYAWARVDPIHGRGGLFVAGRPRRPDDPDGDDGWNLGRFLSALAEDTREIAAVIAEHPPQADRLRRWATDVEELGRRREESPELAVGVFYQRLLALGYRGHHE